MSDEESFKNLQRLIAKMSVITGKMNGEKKTPNFKDFACGYLMKKDMNPTLRDSTKKLFSATVFNHLIPAFGHLELDKVTNEEFLAWVTRKRVEAQDAEPRKKPLTRFFNSRKYLSEIMLAAKEAGHIEKHPKFDTPDEPKKTGRVLEEEEIRAILWRTRRPWRFAFYVFWKMGCRPREILQWEWGMFDWRADGKLYISIPARISKTGRDRTIPISPAVTKVLRILKKRAAEARFVFPNPKKKGTWLREYQYEWERACRLGFVEDAVVYDFRRTFITNAMAAGKGPVFVAFLLDTSVHQIESVYTKAKEDVMEGLFE